MLDLLILDHSSDILCREWWVSGIPRVGVILCEETSGDTHGKWD